MDPIVAGVQSVLILQAFRQLYAHQLSDKSYEIIQELLMSKDKMQNICS